MQITNCDFSNPVLFNGNPPENKADAFNFSTLACTTTDASTELIESTATTTSFYLDKSISYGDFLVVVFLMLFLVGGLVSFLISWFIPKRLNWKMH
jgi:hypothetical protein